MVNIDVETGKKIKTLRVEKNLSQRALAEKCGISHSNLSKIEKGEGNPGMETLIKLSEVLGAGLIGGRVAQFKNNETEAINGMILQVAKYYVPENLELKFRVENAESLLTTCDIPVISTLLGECPGLYDDIKGLVIDVIKNRLNHYIKEDK